VVQIIERPDDAFCVLLHGLPQSSMSSSVADAEQSLNPSPARAPPVCLFSGYVTQVGRLCVSVVRIVQVCPPTLAPPQATYATHLRSLVRPRR